MAPNEQFHSGIEELREIEKTCGWLGYGDGRIILDPSVVRGLEYYTGAVYEVELLLEARTRKAAWCEFGSVGGGGRYDGLVGRFRPEEKCRPPVSRLACRACKPH